MADLIRPSVKIISHDGEFKLQVAIDLNINLNTNNISVVPKLNDKEDLSEKENLWVIPEFKSTEKIKFGKKKE